MPETTHPDPDQADMFADGDYREEEGTPAIPEPPQLIGESECDGVQYKMVQYAPGQWAALLVIGRDVIPKYGVVKIVRVGNEYRPQFVGWGKKIHIRKFFRPDATGQEPHPVLQSLGLDLSYNSLLRLFKNGFISGTMPVPHRILIDIESLSRHLEEASDPDFWTDERVKRFKETIY